MAVPEIEAFLTHLAVTGHVAAAAQNQAFSTLLFLYRHVLDITLDDRINALRAKRSRHLPTVLTPQEARNVIAQMTGVYRILAILLYGSGLRLREALQLRIKDIDFAQHQLIIRDAKGGESLVTLLPARSIDPLQHHLEQVQKVITYCSKVKI